MIQVVIDTNVVVSSLRSRRGTSFALLQTMDMGIWQPCLSTTLLLEYEAVLYRHASNSGFPRFACDAILDAFCAIGRNCEIHFHWRTFLPDPDDDFVLELALASGAKFLISHNQRHLLPAEAYGIRVLTPALFLRTIEKESL